MNLLFIIYYFCTFSMVVERKLLQKGPRGSKSFALEVEIVWYQGSITSLSGIDMFLYFTALNI